MKLSEAMRKGSKTMRQEFGCWERKDGGGCALTMAAKASGFISPNASDLDSVYGAYQLVKRYPILTQESEVPCGCQRKLSNFHGIIHLNDRHFWSAERIAGWIESQLEAPTYSMLEIQEFMGEPVQKEAQNV